MRVPAITQRMRIYTPQKQRCGSNLSLSFAKAHRSPAQHHHTRYTSSRRPLTREGVTSLHSVAPKTWNVTDMARSPTRADRMHACSCSAHAVHARQPLSAPSRNGLPRVHALQVRCRASVSCSRTPPLLGLHQLTPNRPAGRGEQLCITGQDLSSVLVETSVYAPSGLL